MVLGWVQLGKREASLLCQLPAGPCGGIRPANDQLKIRALVSGLKVKAALGHYRSID